LLTKGTKLMSYLGNTQQLVLGPSVHEWAALRTEILIETSRQTVGERHYDTLFCKHELVCACVHACICQSCLVRSVNHIPIFPVITKM
jgi:hypothetical protein